MVTPKLVELINEKKNKNEQKFQLSMGLNFMHTTDRDKNGTFYVKSDNAEIRIGSKTNDVVAILFESFLNNYQKEEQILRNGSNYTFESVDVLGIHFHNIKLKRGRTYIDSPAWIQNKHATINPKNIKDYECFKYAIIAALHHQEIGKDPQRISKHKPCINNYNRKDIDFPSGSNEYKKFEQNNRNIALNILSVPPNKEEINIIYKSQYNRKREKQVVLLMITKNNPENTPDKWHYLAVNNIPRLFRGITSNNRGDFYCFGCLHSFRTKNKLKNHERLCNNLKYCDTMHFRSKFTDVPFKNPLAHSIINGGPINRIGINSDSKFYGEVVLPNNTIIEETEYLEHRKKSVKEMNKLSHEKQKEIKKTFFIF